MYVQSYTCFILFHNIETIILSFCPKLVIQWKVHGISYWSVIAVMTVRLSLMRKTIIISKMNSCVLVSSLMSDLANSNPKLSVASSAMSWTQLVAHWYWLCVLCAFFQFHRFSFFIESCSFVDKTSPLCSLLCSLFPMPNCYVQITQKGFEGVFVAFLLATFRTLSLL